MRRMFTTLALVVMFLPLAVPAQTLRDKTSEDLNLIRVCIVEVNPGVLEPPHAKQLASELSQKTFRDGVRVDGVPVIVKSKKQVKEALERAECAYVVSLTYHESADRMSDVCNGDLCPPFSPMPIHDSDALIYQVRKAGASKLLKQGSAPPPIVYARQGHRLVTPYPKLATEIMAAIDRTRSAPSSK